MARNLVLLSAGLDSMVNLIMAGEKGGVDSAVTVDYGQHAAGREVSKARAACDHFGVEHIVLQATWLADVSENSLTGGAGPVPRMEPGRLEEGGTSMSSVWVPNRNGLLANMGACLAEARGVPWVVMGLNAEEARAFPDNSPEFIEEANKALAFSTSSGVKLRSFTISWNKVDIYRTALAYDLDFGLIWSCYNGSELMCGKCESCARLLRAAGELEALDRIRHLFYDCSL